MAAKPGCMGAVALVEPDAGGVRPEVRRGVQERRLRGLVGRLLGAGGVQGERLRDVGVGGVGDVSLEELWRLPFVTKQDLWDHYPEGLRTGEPIVCIHGSSGTGGRPTLVAVYGA